MICFGTLTYDDENNCTGAVLSRVANKGKFREWALNTHRFILNGTHKQEYIKRVDSLYDTWFFLKNVHIFCLEKVNIEVPFMFTIINDSTLIITAKDCTTVNPALYLLAEVRLNDLCIKRDAYSVTMAMQVTRNYNRKEKITKLL